MLIISYIASQFSAFYKMPKFSIECWISYINGNIYINSFGDTLLITFENIFLTFTAPECNYLNFGDGKEQLPKVKSFLL